MPGSDSVDKFRWLVVYDNGVTISQSGIDSYQNLPDKQKILSASILHENDVLDFISCPEADYYPYWFHRTTQKGNKTFGMHVLAKIHINTQEAIQIKFFLDNGQVFVTDHWWEDHAYFFKPDFTKLQEINA